jgi:hypothetical protein
MHTMPASCKAFVQAMDHAAMVEKARATALDLAISPRPSLTP